MESGDATFPHSASHLNCPIPTVSLLELVLSHLAFASTVKASYNCHKSVVRKTLPAALVDTFYRTLLIFFLTVLPLSLYANLSLALQSEPGRVAQNCWVCAKFRCFSILRKGVGWHHPSIKSLQK